jgi:hypothetical protein
VSPVRYELGFLIPKDILHSHRRENRKPYKINVCILFPQFNIAGSIPNEVTGFLNCPKPSSRTMT